MVPTRWPLVLGLPNSFPAALMAIAYRVERALISGFMATLALTR